MPLQIQKEILQVLYMLTNPSGRKECDNALSLGFNQAGQALHQVQLGGGAKARQRGRLRPHDSCEVQLPKLLSSTWAISARGGWCKYAKTLIGSRRWLGVVFESATPGMLPHVNPQWRMENCPIKTLNGDWRIVLLKPLGWLEVVPQQHGVSLP